MEKDIQTSKAGVKIINSLQKLSRFSPNCTKHKGIGIRGIMLYLIISSCSFITHTLIDALDFSYLATHTANVATLLRFVL